jgi:Protein of unknown function (DUF3048) N-terminal domain/Protein of unknown function (DUF3048) C-terminal domain
MLALTAVLLSGVLALSACSGDESGEAESRPSPSDATTADSATLARRWPLTGLPARSGIPTRRAVVVKIDNTSNSEPQVGLGDADLVVQQLVEGGVTRLAAFYYSRIPDDVGPVRSMRTSDVGIVKPANAILVASGGAPPTVRRMKAAGIPTATEGAVGYHRVGDRSAPYNLFMYLDQLVKERAQGGRPPSPYLPWGDAKKLGRGKPAGTLTARFSGGTANTWTYGGQKYRRSIDHTNGRDDFRPDSVVVLRVQLTDAGYRDPAGNPVPETILTGTGAATLFHGGRAYEGRWRKRAAGSPLRLVGPNGRPMRVPPGRTWIELVPASGGALTYSR